jgi:hypothetical protein
MIATAANPPLFVLARPEPEQQAAAVDAFRNMRAPHFAGGCLADPDGGLRWASPTITHNREMP